jgi:transposase
VPIAIQELPQDIDACHTLIKKQHAELEQAQSAVKEMHSSFKQMETQLQKSHNDVELLSQKVNYLLRVRFGQKAERVDHDQLRLFSAPTEIESKEVEKTITVAQHERKGHGRKKRDLPRIRKEYTLPEDKLICQCCNAQLKKIGEVVNDQLEYIPASMHIIEHAEFKYACPNCAENVVTASKPQQPIDKGLPGPGLLAYVATSKYGDHLPLHRLEHILKRQGAEIKRSTMCDWMAATANLLEPMWNIMKGRLLKSAVIHTDDTVLPVLDKNLKKTRQGRIWVYIGDKVNPFTLFDYTKSRERDGPLNFLNGFNGYLQADAFKGYDCIFASELVKEVACWAHTRRYFFDAFKSAPKQAGFAIAKIRELYKIEQEIKELSPKERLEIRKIQAKPILDEIKKWLDEQVLYALPKSFISKAIKYALNNWDALCIYTEDERLNIDNNLSERAIRPVVIGRKNWLFAGSDKGGRMAAILNSIVATCQRHKIDPQAYLADILPKLPGASPEDLVSMLPGTWLPKTT